MGLFTSCDNLFRPQKVGLSFRFMQTMFVPQQIVLVCLGSNGLGDGRKAELLGINPILSSSQEFRCTPSASKKYSKD
jgi:hypothetical protein